MICPSCGAPNSDDGAACAECGTPTLPLPAMGPGFVLASRYEIQKVLGRGGMGVVYKAHDRLLEETVAIKVLRPDVSASADHTLRFRAEIKMARAVSHKNVCRIHEYGEDRGIHYISMAYVDGIDLKQVLRQQGPLAPGEAFEVVTRVADALQAIHDEGIVHRDLKTPNIMLDGRGIVRLMDFGIAKQNLDDGLSMTVTGQIIGTPEYMSPEQVQAQRLDGRSDIYSLGIVAFEVFTGVTPFRADTPLGTALKHLNESPPLEGPQATLLPAALVPVLRKALAKRREDRYASARDAAQAFEAACALTPEATERLAKTAPASTMGEGETMVATLVKVASARVREADQATTALGTGRRPGVRPPWRWIATALAAAALIAGAVAWVRLRPAPLPSTVVDHVAPVTVPPEPVASPSAAPSAAPAASVAPLVIAPRASSSTRDQARSASEVRAAQASFNQGRYEDALRHAREALRLDPSEAAARTLAEGAAAGREADRHLQAAEAALVERDLDRALKAVDAAAAAAPWDVRAAPLRARIQEQRSRARTAVDPRVERLLAEGDGALEAQNFDTAIARYDQALKLDPGNSLARMGRATAVNAKATRAAAARAPAKASFVAGRTVAESVETRPDTALAAAFEETPGIEVTRDTQPALLPGRIEFKTDPATVGPGERYKLEVRLVNTGTAADRDQGDAGDHDRERSKSQRPRCRLRQHGRPGPGRRGAVALRHAARGPAKLVARGRAAHDARRGLPQPAGLDRPGRRALTALRRRRSRLSGRRAPAPPARSPWAAPTGSSRSDPGPPSPRRRPRR